MYCGYVTTIRQIRKHENADRLQVVDVFGNSVIVDLNYHAGDRVVYFPVDGQLSEEFCRDNDLVRRKDENGNSAGGYLDPDKRNIRAIRLRGEKSEGLILPIESLSRYADTTEMQDGEQISVLNGHEICKKYIPRRNPVSGHTGANRTRSNKERDAEQFPFFAQHVDTEQLAYNQSAFHEGDTIYLTQKLHGTSFRVANTVECVEQKRNIIQRIFKRPARIDRHFTAISGTRRVVLRDFEHGYYGNDEFRKSAHEFFAKRLPKGWTVYGEIVGWVNESTPIMPRCDNSKVKDKEFSKRYGKETVFTYGCAPGENRFYVYRVTVTNDDGIAVDLPTEEVKYWCEVWGCEYVPLLEKFLYTTWEGLNERCQKYLDVPEPLADGAHVTEGVVVRIDNRKSFTAYKTKSFAFKVLEGIIKDEADAPDMEEAQDLTDEEAQEA